MKIPFNIPPVIGTEIGFIQDAINKHKLCGDNFYTKACNRLIEKLYCANKALITTSCTHALEMSALLCEIKPGDEVIMPSFTFVSTANAFVLRGAKIVFVDIRPDTQNINEKLIEAAITEKPRAIVPVHYAGVGCEMEYILALAKEYSLNVVEDAAQGVNAYYRGAALGTIGDYGSYSFHETKNYSMGEGGALLVNSPNDNLKAEIIREKGTNRAEFLLGMVDKYTWVDKGSSYLPSELGAAFLYAQLNNAEQINNNRIERYNQYYAGLKELEDRGYITLPGVPEECKHNAHMFYIKTKNLRQRCKFIEYMKEKDIICVFHYVPLHSSPYGKECSVFCGNDNYTTDTSQRLVRLPMYKDLTENDVDYVLENMYSFFKGE